MSEYLENPWIAHYLDEIDAAIDEYLAAKRRGDFGAVKRALKVVELKRKHVETRAGKVEKGKGDTPNDGGWNPPGVNPKTKKKDLPPEAVRATEES